MGAQLTTLTASDLERFERDGYLMARQAFARADGLALEREWWRELEPRLLIEQERRMASERHGSIATLRDRFHRSHPWLMALTGQAPSPADRIAAFMDRETIVEDVPLRVVELTGEPGDMVFCHPVMVHCAAPNRGERPRFMRIKTQILTHEGRALRNAVTGRAGRRS